MSKEARTIGVCQISKGDRVIFIDRTDDDRTYGAKVLKVHKSGKFVKLFVYNFIGGNTILTTELSSIEYDVIPYIKKVMKDA